MSYQYKGADVGAGIVTVEQERRRNAELHLELRALTAENAEIVNRIRLMRDELTTAYRKLRRQVSDLEAVRAQEQLIAEAETFTSTLPEPIHGGREGLQAATEEMMLHESKDLKLSKVIQPTGPSHGTRRRYQAGCRCQECRGINAVRRAREKRSSRSRSLQGVAA